MQSFSCFAVRCCSVCDGVFLCAFLTPLQGMLIDLLAELCGDVEHGCGGGAVLQQLAVPAGLVGRPYGEAFMHLALSSQLLCLGLYRRKSENPGTRLSYVVCNPQWEEPLESTDRFFVLRPRATS